MADAGSDDGFDMTTTITFTDFAAAPIPSGAGQIAPGDYRPGSYSVSGFPPPAPMGPYNEPQTNGTATFSSVFGGTLADGDWDLYVFDDAGLDGNGQIAGGWCIEINQPTAANASITGRVLSATGRGLGNVIVSIRGDSVSQTMHARTNQFGYYVLEDIPAGETYVLSVGSKRYTFRNPNRAITVNDNLTGIDFIAEE